MPQGNPFAPRAPKKTRAEKRRKPQGDGKPLGKFGKQQQGNGDKPPKKGGKGAGKGAGLPKGQKLATKFEGKELCFSYNNKESSKGGCGRSHLCQICFAAHPMSSHSE